MASKLFRELYQGAGQQQKQAQPNLPNISQELQNLRTNPMGYLMSKKLNIPPEIQNNPQAIVQHWMNTGQMSPQQLQYLQSVVFGNNKPV